MLPHRAASSNASKLPSSRTWMSVPLYSAQIKVAPCEFKEAARLATKNYQATPKGKENRQENDKRKWNRIKAKRAADSTFDQKYRDAAKLRKENFQARLKAKKAAAEAIVSLSEPTLELARDGPTLERHVSRSCRVARRKQPSQAAYPDQEEPYQHTPSTPPTKSTQDSNQVNHIANKNSSRPGSQPQVSQGQVPLQDITTQDPYPKPQWTRPIRGTQGTPRMLGRSWTPSPAHVM